MKGCKEDQETYLRHRRCAAGVYACDLTGAVSAVGRDLYLLLHLVPSCTIQSRSGFVRCMRFGLPIPAQGACDTLKCDSKNEKLVEKIHV